MWLASIKMLLIVKDLNVGLGIRVIIVGEFLSRVAWIIDWLWLDLVWVSVFDNSVWVNCIFFWTDVILMCFDVFPFRSRSVRFWSFRMMLWTCENYEAFCSKNQLSGPLYSHQARTVMYTKVPASNNKKQVFTLYRECADLEDSSSKQFFKSPQNQKYCVFYTTSTFKHHADETASDLVVFGRISKLG